MQLLSCFNPKSESFGFSVSSPKLSNVFAQGAAYHLFWSVLVALHFLSTRRVGLLLSGKSVVSPVTPSLFSPESIQLEQMFKTF